MGIDGAAREDFSGVVGGVLGGFDAGLCGASSAVPGMRRSTIDARPTNARSDAGIEKAMASQCEVRASGVAYAHVEHA